MTALLVGNGTHEPGSRLPDVPAVARTVRDLAEALVQLCGLDRANLRVLVDPSSPGALGEALTEAATQASDVLMFYYVGHGLVSRDNELYLSTRVTSDHVHGLEFNALPYSAVRRVIAECRARTIVVVLDCCFAGRASLPPGNPATDGFDIAQAPGTYLLAAAAKDERAWAEPESTHTAFTGALIGLLRDGDPAAPPRLTLDRVYHYLSRVLPVADPHKAEPQRYASGHADGMVVTVNRAYRPPAIDPSELPRGGKRGVDQDCPYLGLTPFEVQDAHHFFGREELTHQLIDAVSARPPEAGPLVLVGPSGAGKTSVLNAGLLPALARKPGEWRSVWLRPGSLPLQALAEAMDARPSGAARLVLVVDQFEELFTDCPDEGERGAFVHTLCTVGRSEPAASVVLAIRADFYGHCLAYPELKAALDVGQILVGPMSTAELRSAIEAPAEAAGLALEDGLVDVVLHDLRAGHVPDAKSPSALPLLSHTLQATWHQGQGRLVTMADYWATGGIYGAVAQTAEEVYQGLDLAAQRAVRQLLLRMVRIGDGTDDTRRPVDLDQLTGPDISRARDALADPEVRLITLSERHAEIAHDALLRAWPRFREWIDEDRTRLLGRQQLRDAAQAWQQAENDHTYLYAGSRLATVRTWADDRDLSPVERRFLDASTRRERHRARVARRVIILLAVLLLVATAAGGWALHLRNDAVNQRNEAVKQQHIALSRALAAQSSRTTPINLRKADLQALAAWRTDHNFDSLSSLLNSEANEYLGAFEGHTDFITALAVSPDSRLLASASSDHSVRLWDLATRRPVATFPNLSDNTLYSVAFSPDGQTLSAGMWDARGLRQWDVATHNELPVGDFSWVSALAYSSNPDHPILALAAGADKSVRLWDPARKADLPYRLTGYDSNILGIAFSPDNGTIATAGEDGKVRLWNAATGAQRAVFDGHTNSVFSIRFSPDGRTLATGSADHTVRIWDVTTGKSETAFKFTLEVPSVAFNHTGTSLISTSDWLNIQHYNVAAHKPSTYFQNLNIWLTQVAISPDGHTLVVGGKDGSIATLEQGRRSYVGSWSMASLATSHDSQLVAVGDVGGGVHLWPVDDPLSARVLAGVGDHQIGMALNRDGTLLISARDDHTARVWDVSTGRHVAVLTPPGDFAVWEAEFTPDGSRIITSSTDGTAVVWDAHTYRQLATMVISDATTAAPGVGRGLGLMAYNPDTHTLATEASDARVVLWNTDTYQEIGRIETGHGTLNSLELQPSGGLLATAGEDQTVRLWNVASRAKVGEISQLATPARGIRFSPDGQTLAADGRSSEIRLWNVADLAPLATLSGHSSQVHDIAFGPTGKTLISALSDGTVQVWNLDPEAQAAHLCDVLRSPTFADEWKQLDPTIGPLPC